MDATTPEVRPVRKLRHWKQQYDEKAAFRWRRHTVWSGKTFQAGERIPDDVLKDIGRAKLRRFWESKFIELWEFEDPDVTTGRPVEPREPEPEPDPLAVLVEDERWDEDAVAAVRAALEADEDLTLSEILEHLNTESVGPEEAPVGDPPLPEGVTVSEPNKGWYTLTVDGEEMKVRGADALAAKLEELRGDANG